MGGEGTVGHTIIGVGGTLSGAFGKQLTINNGLVLDRESAVHVTIGSMPSDAALFVVNGDLDLNGTLNVDTSGQPVAGAYRIFDYSGTLSGTGLVRGNVSGVANPSTWTIQTAIDHQVNLINSDGVPVQYWDGTDTSDNLRVDGGDGIWNQTGSNWTNEEGSFNGNWVDDTLAIFMGAKGIVDIGDPIRATGLLFQTDDYQVTGGDLTLAGQNNQAPVIQVGYADEASKSWTTTIDSILKGQDGLNKTGNGTLILTKDAQYSGTTTISQGALRLGNGQDQGVVDTDVILAGNHFGDGVLIFDLSKTVLFDHQISGSGEVVQNGSGSVILAGDNSFSGGLTVASGKVQAGRVDSALGSGRVTVQSGAVLDLADFNETVGGLVGGKQGDGDITLGSGILTLNQDFDDQFSGKISGSGGLVKNESGMLTLYGISTYSGDTVVNGGSLIQGADGALSGTSAYFVADGSALSLGGFSTHMVALRNGGTVSFGGSGGTLLDIAGDYMGNGGKLVMNTVLGQDNSKTDMMKVAGSTSGNTTVQVNNRGGLGAQTTKGIELIDIGGRSDGTFTLQGDYVTKDGRQAILTPSAYAYTLQKNSQTDPDDGNWYLVSQYTKDNPSPPLNCEVTDTCPVPPTRFSAAAPVYESYASMLQTLNKLPTLQQRIGSRYSNDIKTVLPDPSVLKTGEVKNKTIWGRIEAAHNRFEPDTTAGHLRQDMDIYIMQAGIDGAFYETKNGRLIIGINGQYGNGQSRISSSFDDVEGGGKITTQGWGLGGTMTWYGHDGFYADGQVLANWYDSDLGFADGNKELKNNNGGFGYAFSAETGKRFYVDDRWSLTPQAQLMFSSVDFDTFIDSYGARVSNRNSNSLNLRLGFAISYSDEWQGRDGKMTRANVYGIGNLYQEFMEGTSIDYAGTRMSSDNDRSWGGIGAGGTYFWADGKYAVYGEGMINSSLNHFADSYALKGTVGFKARW
ncbi:autotransporter family protein [Brucella sp. 2716]|uniref:autotransporter family protein n=1 Tax=Brucella sp. 2716 TaxID=2975052 RepID=UPI00217EF1B5|nr:autotransporter outer membrane beta-barrel domain-containing protein [Brucella sp. 2716]UWF60421.1 autotransporter outer membrane beta-barrel domain-containing protein [Brucella sp. 2716]